MEDDDMIGGQQGFERAVDDAGIDSAWMRRHLSRSIYLWACGEKADNQDDEPKISDRLLGWLVLCMQGFAYTMLIVLARANSEPDTESSADDSDESGYLLPSVTGAMYLLIASTTHDLRVGYSLLVDGTWAGHRTFGMGLLVVYGIMVSAAMTVLVSTSDNSASVVLNAVTVLFVADLDEKALKFLHAVPQTWRLFWALESIEMSFVLALVAIFYIGDTSQLLEDSSGILKTFPTWFVWAVNPAVVTLCSVVWSSTLQSACDLLSEACEIAHEPTFCGMVSSTCEVLKAAIKTYKESFRREPCYCVALAIWIALAANNWFFTERRNNDFPLAVTFNQSTPTSASATLDITDNKLALLYSNIVLAIGVAAKVLGACLSRRQRVKVSPEPRADSDVGGPEERRGSFADSNVPSLLIGSGIGYWVSSTLYIFGCSWHGGGCGWNNAPMVVTIIGYVVVPCFLLFGMFMAADISIFGTRFGRLVQPVVHTLKNRHRIEYWIMAAVFRDFVDVWIGLCCSLRSPLVYYFEYRQRLLRCKSHDDSTMGPIIG